MGINLLSGNFREITFCIAGTYLKVIVNYPLEALQWKEAYSDFLCNAQPEITINVTYNGLSKISLREDDKIFDSQGSWHLYKVNDQKIFLQSDLMQGPNDPYFIAFFDSNLKKIDVYRSNQDTDISSFEGLLPCPLDYPFGEILMILVLSQGRGIMAHACGIDDRGRGYLFAGNSTHGKTTLARLWKDQAIILNDDRIVIRKKGDHFWMYGTPWHGEYTGVSPQGVPIEKIFFLHHADRNSVKKYNGASAASMLLARSFPPLWDAEGMKFTLDFCSQLVSVVPCYQLNFVPDENIVDFIRCVK